MCRVTWVCVCLQSKLELLSCSADIQQARPVCMSCAVARTPACRVREHGKGAGHPEVFSGEEAETRRLRRSQLIGGRGKEYSMQSEETVLRF